MAYNRKRSSSRVANAAMEIGKGYNFSSIGARNRRLVLKMIAIAGPISRTELSAKIGLTKTALGNIVSDLIENNLVREMEGADSCETVSLGRNPILLEISPNSPCIMGILVKRHYLAGIISDLSGRILKSASFHCADAIDSSVLMRQIMDIYQKLAVGMDREISTIGISCIGPIDEIKGRLLNPPDFYGIHDVDICAILQEKTGIPCYIINDANAGALAEKIYGAEKYTQSFIYLHIMNGIGAGYILNSKLYHGEIGQSGEIGHSTINCAGPVCGCGNIGCLELYANIHNMNLKLRETRDVFGVKTSIFPYDRQYDFGEILYGASAGDLCAISALNEFCTYLSFALVNTIKFLNVNDIVVGYDGEGKCVLEKVLDQCVRQRISFTSDHDLLIRHSSFGGDAPLYGAIALVADMVFEGSIHWPGI